MGRFRHFLDVADPRCLAPSVFFGLSLEDSKKIMGEYKAEPSTKKYSDEQLWLAKKVFLDCCGLFWFSLPSTSITSLPSQIYTSAVHPDTGETVLQVGLWPNNTLHRSDLFDSL